VSADILVQSLCCASATILTKRYRADVELTQTEGFGAARRPNRLSLKTIERRLFESQLFLSGTTPEMSYLQAVTQACA
jgi:hypothetical protein